MLRALLAVALAAGPVRAQTLGDAVAAAQGRARVMRAFSTPLLPDDVAQIRRGTAYFLKDWLEKVPTVKDEPAARDMLQRYLADDARSSARDLVLTGVPNVGCGGSLSVAPEKGARLRGLGVQLFNAPEADRFAVVAPGKAYLLATPGWGPENVEQMEQMSYIPTGEFYALAAFRLQAPDCDLEQQLVWVKRGAAWKLWAVLDVF